MRTIRSLIRVLLAITSPACLIISAWSQSSAQPSQAQTTDLVLKKTVRRVIVDVVVSDSNDKPVSGLTAKDFVVKEDRAPQQILTFDIHTLNTAAEPIPKLPPLPPNTFLNLPPRAEQGPLYVILYDMVNME